ncbi:MAG: DNA polymerase III subunit delta [Bacteroidales bacterium]|nr:DNA polymerase III subunit delta [Bacteroidales bacterium]
MKESFSAIVDKISQKIFYPVYLFYGEESYFIDYLTEQIIQHTLPPEERDYSLHILYGKDVKADEVLASLNMIPMFNLYNIYHIREAQEMDIRTWKKLEEYAMQPVSSNILLITSKELPPKNWLKLIETSQQVVGFQSYPLKEQELAKWIMEYVLRHGFVMSKETAQILIFSLGYELSKIINELNKLFIYLSDNKQTTIIDMKTIEEQIGISRKYNSYELINAIAKKDKNQALRIAIYFAKNEGKQKDTSVFLLLPLISSFFEKLFLYHTLKNKINDKSKIAADLGIFKNLLFIYDIGIKNYNFANVMKAIKLLKQYDLAFKGVEANSTPAMLIDLIYKLVSL